MATYSVNWSAVLASTVTNVDVGTCLVMDSTGYHYPATSVNRTSYGRTMGICAGPGDASNRSVQMIEAGLIPASITGLAAGTVSWVRASAAGLLERCTPGVGDDLVGQCHADGSLQFAPGVWDSMNYAGGGGGGGGTSVTGTGFWHNTSNALDPAATALTFTGDTTGTGTGTSIALTTVKVNGATVPAAGSLTTGNIPQVSGASALTYGPLNLAGGSNYVTGVLPVANTGAPSGTGYPHVTGGSYDGAAVSLTWTGDATGTGTGSSFALTVVKANGATVPAAGALTTGNVLQVTGASALGYAAVNLAGGANFVTGVLPTGNQAAQTMAGDVTGTTAASVVAKVNGATVPAAGALTTGNVLQVSGVGALSYAPLNLAGGSNFISNSLPVTNGGTGASTFGLGVLHANGTSAFTSSLIVNADVSGTAAIAASKVVQATGTGFPHVTAGALDAASVKVDLTNAAHVTVPATANGVVTSSGTVLQQAADVLAGSGFVSIGAAPVAAAGAIRFPSAATALMSTRDPGNTVDYPILSQTTTALTFGNTGNLWSTVELAAGAGGIAKVSGANLQIFSTTSAGIDIEVNSQYVMLLKQDSIQAAQPIIGESLNSSPWSVHGKTTVATTGSFSVTAASYAYDAIMFSSAAGGTVTFPLPASDAAAYYKTIIYSGNGTLVVTNGGGAPKNVSLSTNTTVRCLFDTVGVHPVSTAATYP